MNWKPVRRGPFYCSPACGGNCTHHAYMQAMDAATACLRRMKSKGWKIRMNENVGWYWSITKIVKGACLSVRGGQIPYGEKPDRGFHAMLSGRGCEGACDSNWFDRMTFSDPNDAVNHRLQMAENFVQPIVEMIADIRRELTPAPEGPRKPSASSRRARTKS